jgi:hypothetical protein
LPVARLETVKLRQLFEPPPSIDADVIIKPDPNSLFNISLYDIVESPMYSTPDDLQSSPSVQQSTQPSSQQLYTKPTVVSDDHPSLSIHPSTPPSSSNQTVDQNNPQLPSLNEHVPQPVPTQSRLRKQPNPVRRGTQFHLRTTVQSILRQILNSPIVQPTRRRLGQETSRGVG